MAMGTADRIMRERALEDRKLEMKRLKAGGGKQKASTGAQTGDAPALETIPRFMDRYHKPENFQGPMNRRVNTGAQTDDAPHPEARGSQDLAPSAPPEGGAPAAPPRAYWRSVDQMMRDPDVPEGLLQAVLDYREQEQLADQLYREQALFGMAADWGPAPADPPA